MMRIPEELVSLAAERRLIPFLGAGFSASLGLPSWEHMLEKVCQGIEGSIPFEDLMAATNGDLLQVAEYLWLKHDRQIGPIRHQIERSFSASRSDPVTSGPHVELVNLGAGQIYTTNYDDIIEQTYRNLLLPVSPVILPKDVALADTERTQVVKYHGDLTHERSLVLTESAYYKRLDFESPMDLKFRSDLLGKSVLFMGYSFRDINIRIIWFKLMDMMRDIPEADRRPSYIVRFETNPALEELYAAVGLKTIVLSPDKPVRKDTERVALIGEFLFQLSSRAATRGVLRGAGTRDVFVSHAAIDLGFREVQQLRSYGNTTLGRRFGPSLPLEQPIVTRLLTGTVPTVLQEQWAACVSELLAFIELDLNTLAVLERLPDSPALTAYVVQTLQMQGSEEHRKLKRALLRLPTIWQKVWKHDIDRNLASLILEGFATEIRFQATQSADEDIAYLAELTKRVQMGLLATSVPDREVLRDQAKDLLELAARMYPTINTLKPKKTSPPEIATLLDEIAVRSEHFKAIEDIDPFETFIRRSSSRSRAVVTRTKPRGS
jgi:SIR2-like domain